MAVLGSLDPMFLPWKLAKFTAPDMNLLLFEYALSQIMWQFVTTRIEVPLLCLEKHFAWLFFAAIHRILQLSRTIDCLSPLAAYSLLTLRELVPRKDMSRSSPPKPLCMEGLVIILWLCCETAGLEPLIFSLFSIH